MKIQCPEHEQHHRDIHYNLFYIQDMLYWCSCGCEFLYNLDHDEYDMVKTDTCYFEKVSMVKNTSHNIVFPIGISCPGTHHRERYSMDITRLDSSVSTMFAYHCKCSCGREFIYHCMPDASFGYYEIRCWSENVYENPEEYQSFMERTRTLAIVRELSRGKRLTLKDSHTIAMTKDMTIGFLLTNIDTGEESVSNLSDLSLKQLNALLNTEEIWHPIPDMN